MTNITKFLASEINNHYFHNLVNHLNDLTPKETATALVAYADYSSVFGPAQAVLAGNLANNPYMGDERTQIAKSVFMGALDEFMDDEHGGVTHRELACRMVQCLRNDYEDIECYMEYYQAKGIAGYRDGADSLPGAAMALGHHITVEYLADIEYNLINAHMNRVVKKKLQRCDAYEWISRHTTADAHHLEHAVKGVELFLSHYPDMEPYFKDGVRNMFSLEYDALRSVFHEW